MPQHSFPTRLAHYINPRVPETHGPQRKAFRDLGAALLAGRTCGQATLARYFPNFAAASRRLTRGLHNPRREPPAPARAHAQAVVAHLPLPGPGRIALEGTTEDRQPLGVASWLSGRRASPRYWAASTTGELKGAQGAGEQAVVDELLARLLPGLARARRRLPAERGVCEGKVRARLAAVRGAFVFRLPAPVPGFQDQQGGKLGRRTLRGATRRRAWGPRWGLRPQPPRAGGPQARTRQKKGRGAYWHWVSTRPRTAFPRAQA
jgi:hypothetical protein